MPDGKEQQNHGSVSSLTAPAPILESVDKTNE